MVQFSELILQLHFKYLLFFLGYRAVGYQERQRRTESKKV